MEPFGQIFFMIGKIEQVLPDEYYLLGQDAMTNYTKQAKKNWLDPENFWVTVNPQTGFVSTAIVDDVSTQGHAIVDPGNNRIGGADPNNVWMTRQKARYARIVGGVAN